LRSVWGSGGVKKSLNLYYRMIGDITADKTGKY